MVGVGLFIKKLKWLKDWFLYVFLLEGPMDPPRETNEELYVGLFKSITKD